jgi:hypothetical protein
VFSLPELGFEPKFLLSLIQLHCTGRPQQLRRTRLPGGLIQQRHIPLDHSDFLADAKLVFGDIGWRGTQVFVDRQVNGERWRSEGISLAHESIHDLINSFSDNTIAYRRRNDTICHRDAAMSPSSPTVQSTDRDSFATPCILPHVRRSGSLCRIWSSAALCQLSQEYR